MLTVEAQKCPPLDALANEPPRPEAPSRSEFLGIKPHYE